MDINPSYEAFCSLFGEGAGSVVVFDLEWTQNSYASNPRMLHEIIEIGACRLDAEGRTEGRFSALVKPRLYRRVDRHIRQVTGITEAELDEGRGFSEVIADFARFCGDAPRLVTWGRDDYPVLKRNLAFHMQPQMFAPPLDAQLVFGFAHFGDAHRQMNLHAALEETGTVMEVPAHRAVYDAECTAALLPAVGRGVAALDAKKRGQLLAVLEREQRIADSLLRAKETRYAMHTDALRDDAVTNMICPVCGQMMELDVPWFDGGREKYEAIGRCRVHGLAEGQMHLKRGSAGLLTMQQRIYGATEADAERVREAYRLFRMTPPGKRHHRLCMEEVRSARREPRSKNITKRLEF